MLKAKITPPHLVDEHKLKEKENKIVLNYLTIRKIVGWLGVLLPLILIVSCFLLPQCDMIQGSVSDYHNTISRDVFVGLLCAISLFLFAYKGYEPIDGILANITGIFGFCVAFFPTRIDETCCTIYPHLEKLKANYYEYPHWVGTFHLVVSALFLLMLAYYSFVLFTRTDKDEVVRGKRKRWRNKVYRTSGGIIAGCVLALIILFLPWLKDIKEKLTEYKIVLILEWISLFAFGFSWMVKGKTMGLIAFLQDKPGETSINN